MTLARFVCEWNTVHLEAIQLQKMVKSLEMTSLDFAKIIYHSIRNDFKEMLRSLWSQLGQVYEVQAIVLLLYCAVNEFPTLKAKRVIVFVLADNFCECKPTVFFDCAPAEFKSKWECWCDWCLLLLFPSSIRFYCLLSLQSTSNHTLIFTRTLSQTTELSSIPSKCMERMRIYTAPNLSSSNAYLECALNITTEHSTKPNKWLQTQKAAKKQSG